MQHFITPAMVRLAYDAALKIPNPDSKQAEQMSIPGLPCNAHFAQPGCVLRASFLQQD